MKKVLFLIDYSLLYIHDLWQFMHKRARQPRFLGPLRLVPSLAPGYEYERTLETTAGARVVDTECLIFSSC